MYAYEFFRKTPVEIKHKKWTDDVNRVRNLLCKGKTTTEISKIMNCSIRRVVSLITDIDEETLREALWVK